MRPFARAGRHTYRVGVPINRGVKPMASAGLLRVPILGTFLKAVGCFPKEKFTKDRKSMKMLQQHYDNGYVVLLFPEGNRSWNGETAEINPGIGRLIKRMDCKVVYARINSGYLHHPRWAHYPRWIPIEATYDGPHEYSEQSAEEITADVQARLQVKPHLKKPARVWGFRMAHGLTDYLWACPKCITTEALDVPRRRGNTVRCTSCKAEWEIDVFSMMNGSSTLSVGDAFRRIEGKLGTPPVVDAERLEETGIILSGPSAKLYTIPRNTNRPALAFEAELQLRGEGLRMLSGGTVIWDAPFTELGAFSIEVANTLHFRVGGVLFRAVVAGQSPLKCTCSP